jgi:lipoyl(octanoyl) transferase 2
MALSPQHLPVYTLGKRGVEADLLVKPEDLGASVYRSPRGGEVTYHGPGQLVCYPIVSLRDLALGVRAYVESLEEAMVRVAGLYGIHARVSPMGCSPVWTLVMSF